MNHGAAAIADDGARGARGFRPFAQRASAAPRDLVPHLWSQRLQYCESVDAHLRRHLLTSRAAPELKAWLSAWADVVDTKPNLLFPVGMRDARVRFDSNALRELPFAHVDGIPVTSPPPKPKPQPEPNASYRPRNIVPDILTESAASRLAEAVRLQLDDFRRMRSLRPGETFTRRAKPCAISQSEYNPSARGVIWNTEVLHYDNVGPYFKPVDFDEPTASHLHCTRMFDALGDDYPDQETRFMQRDGYILVNEPDLMTFLSPHLLSLANGISRVDAELERLSSPETGYISKVDEHALHLAKLPDDTLLRLAFGRFPFVCQSQGTVEKKLKPGAPRRIQDPGQPRRPFAAPDRTPVVPTNEQMERDEQPPERKSLTLHVLRDLAILLAISLVWKEPLLAFTHDFKDFFNQLHLHPSQTWMATILWSEAGRMRHYIEKSLAFGQKKSSNYAQRWANAVITIMWSRFDAEERKLFDAETDPERRAVINQRDALSTLTGRNEMRCAAAHVYTDDTIGLVVGFERFVRLITCW